MRQLELKLYPLFEFTQACAAGMGSTLFGSPTRRACWEECCCLTASGCSTSEIYCCVYTTVMLSLSFSLSVTEHCRHARAKPFLPNTAFLWWAVLWLPISLAETFSELHRSLRLLLPKPPSFSLSFHRCQTCIVACGSPTCSSSLSLLSFPGVSPSKSLVFLTPSWHLLPRGPKQALPP